MISGREWEDEEDDNMTSSEIAARERKQEAENKGNVLYEKAWIDHGFGPQNADYEYAVLVRSNPMEMKAFSANPSYR